ncbi:MAG: DinB family protein [Saprospiraceae bacterium]
MKKKIDSTSRRKFIKKSATLTLATGSLLALPQTNFAKYAPTISQNNSINYIGPKEGYTPQIGTLVSMMNWMRNTILRPVQGMSIKDLDYLHDENSNSIGAMLWHLAATERFYQINTFEEKRWGNWERKDRKEFSIAMSLGNTGRAKIKGNKLDFYLEKLNRVREYSLKELAKLDDEWLLKIDPNWMWSEPTNNYCKWFHVVEHESNHNGQIKFLKSRLPS